MNIIIRNISDEPIYIQIYNQIKNAISIEDIKSGELLPSIRNLAKDLKISVITTKRAYDELEKEGYIYSVAGKGFYVSEKNSEIIREANLKEIEDCMRKIQELSNACKLTTEDIIEMFRVIAEEDL